MFRFRKDVFFVETLFIRIFMVNHEDTITAENNYPS